MKTDIGMYNIPAIFKYMFQLYLETYELYLDTYELHIFRYNQQILNLNFYLDIVVFHPVPIYCWCWSSRDNHWSQVHYQKGSLI